MALLGLLAFCALISEGAAADWSSVYLDRLGGGDLHPEDEQFALDAPISPAGVLPN